MPKSNRINACLEAIRALDAALAGELRPIPPGWFSRQMLQSEGLSRDQAKAAIQKMKHRGIVEVNQWKTASGTVPIYRVREK